MERALGIFVDGIGAALSATFSSLR